jgi:SulP family sulfate permease
MGLTGLGAAVTFIPRPVTIGFTSGIALRGATQIKDFLCLHTGELPSLFIARMRVLASHLNSIDWPTCAIACASLVIVIFWRRLTKRAPGSIVALIFGRFSRRRCPSD